MSDESVGILLVILVLLLYVIRRFTSKPEEGWKELFLSHETMLIIGGTLIVLRLFFPPVYLKYGDVSRKYLNFIERFEHDRYYPDYSLAFLHALGIAIATGIVFYLLIEKRKHEERDLVQRLRYVHKKWNIEDKEHGTKVLMDILKKYELEDKETKNQFFRLLEYPLVKGHFPTDEVLRAYPGIVLSAVADYYRYLNAFGIRPALDKKYEEMSY